MIIVDRRKEYHAKEIKHRMNIDCFGSFVQAHKDHMKIYRDGVLFQLNLKLNRATK